MDKQDLRVKKKKGKGPVIAIVVVLLLIGGAAGLLFFNVANIRDSMFNLVRDWPVIGPLIPYAEDDDDRVPRLTAAELSQRNDVLQRQNDTLTRDVNSLRQQNENLQRELERLREFEERQEQFAVDLAEFHAMVLEQVGLSEFWRFFQQFNPDMAEQFAREAAGEAQVDAEVRRYLNTIREMEPRSAAGMLEGLMDASADLVVRILNNRRLTTTEVAMILEAMDTEMASTLLRLMAPDGLID